jgi:hypothetical protein
MFLDAGTDHNTWVKAGMAAKAAGLDFEDFHDWSARAGNYRNEAECRSVWQSIKEGGIGPVRCSMPRAPPAGLMAPKRPPSAHNRTKRSARSQSNQTPAA